MNKLCDIFCNPRHLALFVVAASVAALGFAYTLQYGFNMQPCDLCMMQRIPYRVAIALGLVALGTARIKPRLAFALLLLAGAAFLANVGISFFHFGVEQKWWPLPGACEGDLPSGSVEDLKKFLENRMPTNCGVPAFVLFGVSLTGYNFLLSVFLAGFTFLNAINGRPRDQAAPKA